VTERPPDFDILVGSDLDAAERERLRRVHDLLVEAGPPPELPDRAPVAPLARRRRRRGALLAVAAALAVAAFALGIAVGDGSRGRATDFVVPMTGTDAAADASASLVVYELDDAGNWPMELEVEGLPPSATDSVYELWLTRDGRAVAICGSFLTQDDGTASVPMNAPWPLDDFDGWLILEEGSKQPMLST
jgi:Anti-sigma-K factor rskA